MTIQRPSFDEWKICANELTPESRAFINGEFVDACSGKTFVRHSPIDGRELANIARCEKTDVDKAVSISRKTFESGVWRNKTPQERKSIMLAWTDLIKDHTEELALLETLDVGKPISDSLNVDVPNCYNCIAYYAEFADKIYDEVAPTGPSDQALIKRMPLGVVAAIVPWNYPLIISSWKIGPALIMGNSVILKPAEQSSLSALLLAKLAKQAGIPDGVFNVVTGLGEEAGAALAEHHDVDLIAFTGSTEVGARIMEAAAKSNLKRVALELGGKSPQVVMDDCQDLDAAASAIAWGIYYNAGETCHAGSRLIVHKNIAEDLYKRVIKVSRELIVGHPLDPATQFGALIEPEHKQRVLSYIELAKDEGGSIAMGGEALNIVTGGNYIEPTLITGVNGECRVVKEEIFGPVLVAIEVENEAQAISEANNTEYGLAAAVWTSDINRAHRMSDAIRAGTVWVNSFDMANLSTPFGGFKKSGFGRDRSAHALDKYADLKTVWTHFS